jgi:hypothetical protein
MTTTADGLQYATLTAGSGATVPNNAYVEVNYSGYLTNGTLFDSSLNPGRTPFEFGLGDKYEGAYTVIQGWEEGIPGMKVGETRILVIPAAIGYGATGSPPTIPGNATLIFTVQMLAIVPRLEVYDAANQVLVGLNQSPSTSNGTNFGSVTTNTSSPASSFSLYVADQYFSLSVTGNILLSGDTTDFSITQWNSSTNVFTVTFNPKSKGTHTATITIPTNDPGVPNFTFTVTGVGT